VSSLYLDTSAVLRAALERGMSPEIEKAIGTASRLVTSRLSLVESSRAIGRVRLLAKVSEVRLSENERAIEATWARCEIMDLTAQICESARSVAAHKPLRALDALHLATFFAARRSIPDLDLLTADGRLREAAGL
jgi:predicted nucleic acid-binding protein